ncbi:hypothetical protein AMJ80_08730 [bacterium SM23_31]|nr:MAG: hypothetical protein AMJ80_08730 [bacterium SM23_31]
MARDGYPYIAVSFGAGMLLSIIGMVTDSPSLLYTAGLCGIVTACFVFFFRDPQRVTDADPDDILSPADGYIVAIEEEEEPDFFKTKVKRVSIFLSVFDVHINRIPVTGTVEFYRYLPGLFKAAFKPEASRKNEQTAIGITKRNRKVLFKQIAGILIRRIVCTVKEGQTVKQGERCGMIKFGSRVDVLMPLDTEIMVTKRRKVYGGITCIGRFKNNE